MSKTMVRTDQQLTEIWFVCGDLQATPVAPDTIWEWRALQQPVPYEDGADPNLLHDPLGGAYSDPGRQLKDGTSGTDNELGAGVVDDGSFGGFFQKLINEANTRESVGAGERIPDMQVRLFIVWLTDATYTVSIRGFSYGEKRSNPDDGKCFKKATNPTVAIPPGYVLDAADLGAEGIVGDVAWFVKTRVLDPIKLDEAIV